MWRILCPLMFCAAYFYDVSNSGSKIANLDKMNFRLCMIVLFGVWTVCSCLWECAEKPVFGFDRTNWLKRPRPRCARCAKLLNWYPTPHCPGCDRPASEASVPVRGYPRAEPEPKPEPDPAETQPVGRGSGHTIDCPGGSLLYDADGNLVGGITHRYDGEYKSPSGPTFPPRGDHALSLR